MITQIIYSVLLSASTPVENLQPIETQTELSSYDLEQITCLADNVYHEARGEKKAGQIAVANVVMNRTKSKTFPNTPCKVIKQRQGKSCQFSWVCKGKATPRHTAIYRNMFEMCRDIYTQKLKDNTNLALYFHSSKTRPNWSYRFRHTATIGSHLFYRV